MTVIQIDKEAIQNSSKRLFIGFALPETITEQVCELRATHLSTISGKPVSTNNLHITLSFLGSLDKKQQELIIKKLDFSTHAYINMSTEHFAHFNQAQIIYLGVEKQPKLLSLHSQLRQQLEQCEILTENRQYRPHISLLRKAKQTQIPLAQPNKITWQAKEIHLYQSKTVNNEVEYHIIHTWPLSTNSS